MPAQPGKPAKAESPAAQQQSAKRPGLKQSAPKRPAPKRPGATQRQAEAPPTSKREPRSKQPRPIRQRVAVALPEESAPGHWLRSIQLSGFTFVMLAILVLTIVVLAPSLRTVVEQQNQLAELRASVEEHKDAVNDLEGDIARWDDPAYIEAQARDRIDYVFPGDYTYLVIGEEATATTTDGAPISDDIQTTEVDWARSLLASIVTAGTTTQTAEEIEAPVQ
jgi:cell division protein FtsB